ncbi:SCO6880 family protein [Rathayibacter tritici]|uniref:SCO6880 family protein n=1 Tax=Rathayibacter tritici TaxID=33888 RepID=UPI000CE78B52|nr:SCO6880 family protein [Rathayibacter tritici]PPI47054.1 hypothetical protein C5D18_04730 [Rathayibacter tritici]
MSDEIITNRTYGHWQKPKSAGFKGLGTIGVAVLFIGCIIVIITMMTAGLLPAVIVGVFVAALLVLIVVKDRHGSSVLDRALVRGGWALARNSKAHLYRSGAIGRTPRGTNQLPGILARSQLHEFTDSWGRPFSLVHLPQTGHVSVILNAEPDGSGLTDRDVVDNQVALFGQWMASMADEPGLEAFSITVETAPDTGTRLQNEVEWAIDPHAPAFALQVLRDVAATYPAGSSRVRVMLALTFTLGRTKRRRSLEEMGRTLASRLPSLTDRLAGTGAGSVRPVTATELCSYVRTAYDPAVATTIDEIDARTARGFDATDTDPIGALSWDHVGPTATEAGWGHYRHDSAISTSYVMSEPPRGVVPDSILSALLTPHPDIARKRVTLLYQPIDPAWAARMVQNDLRSARFNSNSERMRNARSDHAYEAAQRTADEEASGAGLVNFGMIVTSSVMNAADLNDADAAIATLGARSRIALRPAYGAQDSAFAAGLPLGIIPSKHVKVPTELTVNL